MERTIVAPTFPTERAARIAIGTVAAGMRKRSAARPVRSVLHSAADLEFHEKALSELPLVG